LSFTKFDTSGETRGAESGFNFTWCLSLGAPLYVQPQGSLKKGQK